MDITHRMINTNGIKMHIAEQGSGPLVLLLHGFPEIWYSWRHQIPALAEAGYHVVAPDLRGYGDTDAPTGAENYTVLHLAGDLIGLLDALGEQKERRWQDFIYDLGRHNKTLSTQMVKLCGSLYSSKPFEVARYFGVHYGLMKESFQQIQGIQNSDFGYQTTNSGRRTWELLAPWKGGRVTVPAKYIVGDQDLVYNSPGSKDYVHKGGFKKNVPSLEEVIVIDTSSSKRNQKTFLITFSSFLEICQ